MRSFPIQIAAFAGLSLLAAHLLATRYGARAPVVVSAYPVLVLTVLATAAVLALIGYVIRLAVWEREAHPTQKIIALVWRRTTLEWLSRLSVLMLVFVFLGAFSTFKSLIPMVHPFAWDAAFSDFDRMLFGTDPWRLTHAVIGPMGTRAIDIAYGLWFPEWVVSLTFVALFSEEGFKRRFIIGFCMVWTLLGVVMAMIFSSAGPCYLELIHHPYAARYDGLFPLQDAPGVVFGQRMLEASYVSGRVGAFQGISAMPSVHVAISAFLALAARRTRWFIPALLFYIVIFIGSVHLGWHYAADGLAGSLGALVCWKIGALGARVQKPASSHSATPLFGS